jgi:hypothetical protein
MSMTIDDVVTGMQTLTLKPDDVLVVLARQCMPRAAIQDILETLSRVLPGRKIIVLDDGLSLARLTEEGGAGQNLAGLAT